MKANKRLYLGVIVAFTCFALTVSCGGGPSSGATPPSNLIYPQATISASVGLAITPDSPTVSGAVSSYTISPALPAGLSFDASTGSISGTPTAVAAQTGYKITATNSSGSTAATVQITVNIAAPSNLIYPQTTISARIGSSLTPDIATVTGTVSSYNVSPALPAGLSLDPSIGVISGTPTASAAQTAFTVTAANPGGHTTSNVTITVQAQNTPLELGYADSIQILRFEGGRVLSADYSGHWVLWNYTLGTLLANGDSTATQSLFGKQTLSASVDMAGQTFVAGITNGLEIRDLSDGRVLSLIVYPGLNVADAVWWKLASDGSHVCIGSQSGLFVYMQTGQIAVSKLGDYSMAKIFAAPGSVLVAEGPSGQNVIETISTADGTSSVSPTFSGQFNWKSIQWVRKLRHLALAATRILRSLLPAKPSAFFPTLRDRSTSSTCRLQFHQSSTTPLRLPTS